MWYFEHSLTLPFFGNGIKTDLSSAVATAEFSKFAGILIKNLQTINAGKGVEKREPSYTVGGNAN